MLLEILKLPVASRVLDSEYDDFVGSRIESVINEVRIFSSYELAHAFDRLTPSKLRNKTTSCKEPRIASRTRKAAFGLREWI